MRSSLQNKSILFHNNKTHQKKIHLTIILSLLIPLVIFVSCNVPQEKEDLYVIKSGSKYGFINQKGDIIITPQFERASLFEDYDIAPFKMDGKWGYLNKKGEIVVAAQFEEAKTFSKDSLARFKMDGKWGFINTDGHIVIPAQFEYASPMNEGHALVVINDELGEIGPHSLYDILSEQGEIKFDFGIINKDGKLKKINIPNAYINQELDDHCFSEGFAPIEIVYLNKNDSMYYTAYTYIDYNGDTINNRKRIELESFPTGGLIISGNGGMKYYSHDKISRKFHNGRAAFYEKKFNKETARFLDRYGFFDTNGDTIIGPKYEMVSVFSEGMAMIMIDNKYGFIDTTGNVIIKPSFDGWGYYKNGICPVKYNDKWGFIDKTGNFVITPTYDMVTGFEDNLCWVKEENKWGAIDTCSNVIIPTKYNSRPYQINDLYLIVDNKKWMYINSSGDTIWRDETIDRVVPKSYRDLIELKNIYDFDNNLSKYKDYFQQNIRDLDEIEGFYHVYCNEVIKDMYSGEIIKVRPQPSEYWAIVFDPEFSEYVQFCKCFSEEDEKTPNHNQYFFKKIGNTNNYDISGPNDVSGKLKLENPIQLLFTVECWQNYGYIGYQDYELIKDYPTSETYEESNTTDWSGTGFAIDDGYIVTNFHVVNGARKILVSGIAGDYLEKYNTQIVATDEKNDIAILKVLDSKFKSMGSIPYGINTALVNEGEDVFVLGYPLTSTMGNEIKLTNGIISSTKGYKDDETTYQIQAPIQPGNSGGPLFDSNGDIIGVICAKHSDAENAGYAIKAIYLENLIKSSGISASVPRTNKIHSKSLAKKVKKVKGFVYKIECSK